MWFLEFVVISSLSLSLSLCDTHSLLKIWSLNFFIRHCRSCNTWLLFSLLFVCMCVLYLWFMYCFTVFTTLFCGLLLFLLTILWFFPSLNTLFLLILMFWLLLFSWHPFAVFCPYVSPNGFLIFVSSFIPCLTCFGQSWTLYHLNNQLAKIGRLKRGLWQM